MCHCWLNAGGATRQETAPLPRQPGRKPVPQSYSHKEPNSANNLNELKRKRPWASDERATPVNIFSCLGPCTEMQESCPGLPICAVLSC